MGERRTARERTEFVTGAASMASVSATLALVVAIGAYPAWSMFTVLTGMTIMYTALSLHGHGWRIRLPWTRSAATPGKEE